VPAPQNAVVSTNPVFFTPLLVFSSHQQPELMVLKKEKESFANAQQRTEP